MVMAVDTTKPGEGKKKRVQGDGKEVSFLLLLTVSFLSHWFQQLLHKSNLDAIRIRINACKDELIYFQTDAVNQNFKFVNVDMLHPSIDRGSRHLRHVWSELPVRGYSELSMKDGCTNHRAYDYRLLG